MSVIAKRVLASTDTNSMFKGAAGDNQALLYFPEIERLRFFMFIKLVSTLSSYARRSGSK